MRYWLNFEFMLKVKKDWADASIRQSEISFSLVVLKRMGLKTKHIEY